MSINLDSHEAITEQVARLFSKGHETYYSNYYLSVIEQMIGTMLGRGLYQYVRTRVILPEPICTYNDNVYVSEPLIAMYLNHPVQLPENKVRVCKQFNVFESLSAIETRKRAEKRDRDRKCLNRLQEIDFTNYSNHIMSYEGDGCASDDSTYSASDMIVLVQLYRIMIMIQHWWIHHTNDTAPNDHKKFRSLEVAFTGGSDSKRKKADDDDDCQLSDDDIEV